jgi:hypothetical protein
VERLLFRATALSAAAAAAIILSSIATMFLCKALYLYLISVSAAPALAALVVGLAAMAVMGLIIVAAVMMLRRPKISDRRGGNKFHCRQATSQIDDVAANLAVSAAGELTQLAQAHPYRTLVLALLSGLAVGGSAELRQTLRKTSYAQKLVTG